MSYLRCEEIQDQARHKLPQHLQQVDGQGQPQPSKLEFSVNFGKTTNGEPFPSEDLTAVDVKERERDPRGEAGDDLSEPEEPGLVGEEGDDHDGHVEHAAHRQALDPAPAEEAREEKGAGETSQ